MPLSERVGVEEEEGMMTLKKKQFEKVSDDRNESFISPTWFSFPTRHDPRPPAARVCNNGGRLTLPNTRARIHTHAHTLSHTHLPTSSLHCQPKAIAAPVEKAKVSKGNAAVPKVSAA